MTGEGRGKEGGRNKGMEKGGEGKYGKVGWERGKEKIKGRIVTVILILICPRARRETYLWTQGGPKWGLMVSK